MELLSFLTLNQAAGTGGNATFADILALPIFCGFQGFIWLIWCGALIFMIASFVLWVIVLIDAVQREFESDNDRLVWVLIILFTGWIGAAIYYFTFMKKSSK